MPVTTAVQETLQVMPDDNSELVPPLPIPNRTVKRLSADDSAATSVKVGHRQANIFESPRLVSSGGFSFGAAVFGSTLFSKKDRHEIIHSVACRTWQRFKLTLH